jgi:2,3-bisphosphoglycerate-dependent phosphoglycerate mutase
MSQLVLIKHGSPVLVANVPARDWQLSPRGEAEAARLVNRLRDYLPFRLVCSPEVKAVRTAGILARSFAIPATSVAELCEIDRPAMPIMAQEVHRQANAGIFSEADRAVVGAESAATARRRFSAGIRSQLVLSGSENLVAVTHGTVISLFVSEHNAVDAFALWSELECGSFVVLSVPSFRILQVRHDAVDEKKSRPSREVLPSPDHMTQRLPQYER